jgi:uncharacterized protein DUF5343
MNIPTAHSAEAISRFLEHIADAPTPKVVSLGYLRRVGFTSGNDPELRHIFYLLGFLDKDGKPQEKWKQYKEVGKEVLEEAIRSCYFSLFELYPETPFEQSDEALRAWFRPATGGSKTSVERAVRTFRKLCQLADMTSTQNKAAHETPVPSVSVKQPANTTKSTQLILQLPILQDRSQYIEILEAIKKVFYE